MGVTRALAAEDAVVWIGSRILRHCHAEVGAHLHTLEDEVDAAALAPLHLPQAGADVVFLAYAFLGPLDGKVVIAGKRLHPLVVLGGALTQELLGDGWSAVDVAEEVHDVLRPGEQWQVTEDDDAVETVVYQCQQAAKELGELLHGNFTVAESREQRWGAKRSSARRAAPGLMARVGVWPMRCVTSSAVPPYTTGVL